MLSKGTTQTHLAELTGLPLPTISGLMGGHARASTPVAHKIAAAIGCPPAAIFPTMQAQFVEAQFTETPEQVAA